MGLRHLCVVDPKNRLVGLITRKDLVNCEEKLVRKRIKPLSEISSDSYSSVLNILDNDNEDDDESEGIDDDGATSVSSEIYPDDDNEVSTEASFSDKASD
jgi:hypothetical protein